VLSLILNRTPESTHVIDTMGFSKPNAGVRATGDGIDLFGRKGPSELARLRVDGFRVIWGWSEPRSTTAHHVVILSDDVSIYTNVGMKYRPSTRRLYIPVRPPVITRSFGSRFYPQLTVRVFPSTAKLVLGIARFGFASVAFVSPWTEGSFSFPGQEPSAPRSSSNHSVPLDPPSLLETEWVC
jgi:hypothetical protein